MDADLKTLLDVIHGSDHEARCVSLAWLGDTLECGEPLDAADAVAVVNPLIAMLAVETDQTVRQSLFSVISLAFMNQPGLADVDMEPLIARLAGANSHNVMTTLYLASMTGNVRYRPLMEGYLKDPHPLVRAEAAKSLTHLEG